MDQQTIDHVVRIVNRAAQAGDPIKRVTWIPPQTGSSDPEGNFIVEYYGPMTGSDSIE